MSLLLRKTLQLFLDSIGRREEYAYYLRRFRHEDNSAFAVICPDRIGLEEVESVLAFDLNFLRQLELHPVLLLCGADVPEMLNILQGHDHNYSVGSINDIHNLLKISRKEGKTAIIAAPDHEYLSALELLVPDVVRRIHFLRIRGQIRDEQGQGLSYCFTERSNPVNIAVEDQPLVELARTLLAKFPGVHVSVASTWDLLQELFTVRGAGCLFSRGVTISRYSGLNELDEKRLLALLEESFGSKLRDSEFLKEVNCIYIAGDFAGAALLLERPEGMYLSKFAVGTQARGEGVAHELWREITNEHKSLFWRAKVSNPICHWYEQRAEGQHRLTDWRVFWRGIKPSSKSLSTYSTRLRTRSKKTS